VKRSPRSLDQKGCRSLVCIFARFSFDHDRFGFVLLVLLGLFFIPVPSQEIGREERLRNDQGPDLQNILRQSYDYLTIMSKLRSTYDRRLIYKTSYEERKDFLGTIHLQNRKIV